MPFYSDDKPRKRSKAGKALDKAYAKHEIGFTYYNKVRNKRKYWDNESSCSFSIDSRNLFLYL